MKTINLFIIVLFNLIGGLLRVTRGVIDYLLENTARQN